MTENVKGRENSWSTVDFSSIVLNQSLWLCLQMEDLSLSNGSLCWTFFLGPPNEINYLLEKFYYLLSH